MSPYEKTALELEPVVLREIERLYAGEARKTQTAYFYRRYDVIGWQARAALCVSWLRGLRRIEQQQRQKVE